MEKDFSIGEAELEIMKVLWSKKEPLSTQLINKAVESKGWKRTTVSTFLTRLVQKGAVSAQKEGNTYLYTPLISQNEYRKAKTKNLIHSLYGGSVRNLTAALFEDAELTDDDINQLKALINSLEDN